MVGFCTDCFKLLFDDIPSLEVISGAGLWRHINVMCPFKAVSSSQITKHVFPHDNPLLVIAFTAFLCSYISSGFRQTQTFICRSLRSKRVIRLSFPFHPIRVIATHATCSADSQVQAIGCPYILQSETVYLTKKYYKQEKTVAKRQHPVQ